MPITGAVMVPHPPLIIPEVGRGQEKGIQATIDAYHEAARRLAAWKPDTVAVLSPHTVMYADYFHISPGTEAEGDFGRFRAPHAKVRAKYDTQLVRLIAQEADAADVPAGTMGEQDRRLDHGTMIPLWFLNRYYGDYQTVRIGLSGLPFSMHYRLGQCIQRAVMRSGKRVAVIASGDLSHRLTKDGPYGFREEGPEYDRRIMEVMGSGQFGGLFDFSEEFCDKAAECGHRSFLIMAGALDGLSVKTQRLSHEGPFGVGYGVCVFEAGDPEPGRDFLRQQEEREREKLEARREQEDAYVCLARQTVETYVRTGKKPPLPDGLPEEMLSRRAGVFVSLKEEGRLRGCIGTISPVKRCIAEEIAENAVSAAARDPRFHPVEPQELDRLTYSVDVLGPTEKISSEKELDVKRYGVVVSRGMRRGLLLPNLEGVDSVEQQIDIARQKAGIPEDAQDIRLERFEVVRHF
ncbi:MAG TPA: AmmeMemoRadiSam system protein A [Candidatus Eisenbergiella stercorigallinarum]|uniref:AmmeMemoRadiSam system protein A n=1 Tax=Candidatus Eisenbergiella stercorigallinarum TaxID=2838557 RepID=A0A9D2QVT1_9FIRM|nr:AmmeMemoRadiSam system protein A [Candidatus Eisenbergiella stercorigallinarum]